MKKIYILLLLSIILISGCENKEEATKNEYIAMKNETLDDANYINQPLPVDIVSTIARIGEEEVNYKVTISNPKENMHNIKVLLVHNYYTENVYPSIGLFNETKELLIDSQEDNVITLEDNIKTTTNISKLGLEMKLLIEYTDDAGERKDVYYKTT